MTNLELFNSANTRVWQEQNRRVRRAVIDQFLDGEILSVEEIGAHLTLYGHARQVSQVLQSRHDRARPNPAASFAYLRLLAYSANIAEQKGASSIRLTGPDTFTSQPLRPDQFQGEILGRVQALHYARILSPAQLRTATDYASNNWDILHEENPHLCLEALSHSVTKYQNAEQQETLSHFLTLSSSELSPYQSSSYNIETRFLAHTAAHLQSFHELYGNTHPTSEMLPTMRKFFQEQNALVIQAQRQGLSTVNFPNSKSGKPTPLLESYSYLAALHTYTYSKF